MKKIRDEDRYTTLEQSEILEPIMDKLGVEADAYYHYDTRELVDLIEFEREAPEEQYIIFMRQWTAYRLDTLLWVLPEFQSRRIIFKSKEVTVFYIEEYDIDTGAANNEALDLFFKIDTLINQIVWTKGSEAIAAAVKLIKLLDDNDLLEEKIETRGFY